MARNQRKKFYIDRRVQGALARRVIVYVALVMLFSGLLGAIGFVLVGGPMSLPQLAEQMWLRFGLAWIASILLVPVVVVDSIRLSHRFCGPMVRIRRAMKDAAAGKQVAPVKLRKGDFWYDFAEDFNQLALQKQQPEAPRDAPAAPHEAVESAPELCASSTS